MSFDVAAFKSMYAGMATNDHVLLDIELSDGVGGYTVGATGVRAFVSGYRPQDIVDGSSLQANDTRCIILADDLPGGLRPLEKRDRIRLQTDGKAYSVVKWDVKTRRVGPTLLAAEAQLRG